MKNLFFLLLSLSSLALSAQTPNQLLQKASRQFASVKSFTSNVNVNFDLPSIGIEDMTGQAFYKTPGKFRIKLTGIAFLPKDNPFNVYTLIRDSSQYASVSNGTEKVAGELCNIISVIPNADADIVMAKIWLGSRSNCPLKMQITSRTNGVVLIESTYGQYAKNALPDKMRFSIDMNKFKVPKAVAVDINSNPQAAGAGEKSKGTIEFVFSKYALNAAIDDKVFSETGE